MGKLTGENILVTGGAGFIGSHLAEALLEEGANVAVPYLHVDPQSIFALHKLRHRVTAKHIDIRNYDKLRTFVRKFRPSYIYHLAAVALVTDAYDDPHRVLETNIMGTVNLLEIARTERGIKKIIVASSDKAYGKTVKPYNEETPLAGDHPYDVSKSGADLICHAYFRTYHTPVVVTRFGNVYGEGDIHMDRLIPGLCTAIAKQKIFEIRSNGKYVRDYLYVKDVVNGYLLLLKHHGPKILGEAYNFSSGDTFSVLALIQKMEKILSKKIRYKIMNSARNEIPYQHLNDTKIRKLGWKPQYTFDGSIRTVYQWYAEQFG